ncbi:MAG: MotA/TolQ/ExbB proton channel family protein [Planctomycetota bacterium]
MSPLLMNTLLLLTLLLPAQAAPKDGSAPAAADAAVATGVQAPATDAASAETPANEQSPASTEAVDDDSGSLLVAKLNDILNSGAIGLLRQGGWFMWPILVMGVVAAGVIIERYRSLKMLSSDSEELRRKVHALLDEDRVEEALKLCDQEQGPVPAILSSGLRKFVVLRRLNYDAGRIEEQVVKAMDDYSVHVVAALERHLAVLATVASVAPMLGFLGTVSGMINSFKEIVAKMGEMNIVEAAAGGISEALLTTCFGLIVGIPAFMAFNYFTSVINSFVLDVEESATELIEGVTLQMALEQQSQVEATGGR